MTQTPNSLLDTLNPYIYPNSSLLNADRCAALFDAREAFALGSRVSVSNTMLQHVARIWTSDDTSVGADSGGLRVGARTRVDFDRSFAST